MGSEAEEGNGEFDISLDTEEQKKAAEEEAAGEMDVDIEDAEGAADEEDDDEVFDYTKAESVLHGKRDGEKDGRKKKPFDPYVKSMDAPKGMRRLQTERAGNSHTFKS